MTQALMNNEQKPERARHQQLVLQRQVNELADPVCHSVAIVDCETLAVPIASEFDNSRDFFLNATLPILRSHHRV